MFTTSGKFLQRDGDPFEIRGVTYGPFAPGDVDSGLVPPQQIAADMKRISSFGLNAIRTYELPSRQVLDVCQDHGISVLATVPWSHHVDFLSQPRAAESGRDAIRRAADQLGDHPALIAFSVANEIETTLVRWLGADRVRAYLEELIDLGRSRAPGALFSYASYPSTEYLSARNADFLTYNVFLEDESVFRCYLDRLQLLAGDRPLVLGEFGLDSNANGRDNQAETLGWGIRAMREAGAAGSFVFAFSDRWFRGGNEVEGWDFGIVDRNGRKKPAAAEVKAAHAAEIAPVDGQLPMFSVICCSRNGSSTLDRCLGSLAFINYPNYEVIVVDDGSTDSTAKIAQRYADEHEHIGLVQQEHGGLSVARNFGAELAKGEILAYIDDDAWAHPNWLRFLALRYADDRGFVAVGGPNIFPNSESAEQASVAASPGRPCHVMLDDVRAEHIPGCNLSVRRSALVAIGGFDPRFTSAGDDVDFCWRLIDEGWEIGFSPGAMVWHAPRRTREAYLRQQRGYGRAEALLARKHRPRFEGAMGIHWHGAIYGGGDHKLGPDTIIYRGVFGTAGFQAVYGTTSSGIQALSSNPFWLVLGAIALPIGLFWHPALLMALVVLGTNSVAALQVAKQAVIEDEFDQLSTRVGVGILAFLQPVVRGVTRWWGMLLDGTFSGVIGLPFSRFGTGRRLAPRPKEMATVWNPEGLGRNQLLPMLEQQLRSQGIGVVRDDGWQPFDLRVREGWWRVHDLLTVTEYHENGAAMTRIGVGSRYSVGAVLIAFCVLLLLAVVGYTIAALALLPVVAAGIAFAPTGTALRQQIESAGDGLKDFSEAPKAS